MMSDDKQDSPKAEQPKRDAVVTELKDSDLEKVTGGFNPQPDPPGGTHE